ncbi:MAG: NUDIX hydrolase [Candidatus Melainabacteria bacterium]|nr:MAG: NUDIX hydrolase [Candidatus Melainabacteria bacterium]
MKESAGTLLYRNVDGRIEVLLVHPSGNYNKNAKWGIPKGVPDEGENFEQAARRETLEETGVVAGELKSLGFVEYTKSRKRVHCFCGPAPDDAAPHCASWEVDKAEFVTLDKAKDIIHQDQGEFITRLESLIGVE